MKTLVTATLVIATAAFAFASTAQAGGIKVPNNVYANSLKPIGLNKPLYKAPPPVIQAPPLQGGPIKFPGKFPGKGPGPQGGMNDDMLAFGIGLATVGAIAAAASQHSGPVYVADDDDGCWYEKQVRYHKNGKPYLKKVLVCE